MVCKPDFDLLRRSGVLRVFLYVEISTGGLKMRKGPRGWKSIRRTEQYHHGIILGMSKGAWLSCQAQMYYKRRNWCRTSLARVESSYNISPSPKDKLLSRYLARDLAKTGIRDGDGQLYEVMPTPGLRSPPYPQPGPPRYQTQHTAPCPRTMAESRLGWARGRSLFVHRNKWPVGKTHLPVVN